MLFPAVTGLGLAAFETLKSASPAIEIPVVTVAVLLAKFVSWVALPTVTVSTIGALPALTVIFSVKVVLEPGATLGFVQLIGFVVVQSQPAGAEASEPNVVLFG